MALKNINFKELLIEKGEKIGLAVFGGISLLLVIVYLISAVTGNNSPGANVADLRQLKSRAESAWQNSKPSPDLEKLPPELQAVEVKRVDAEAFPTPMNYFTASQSDDRKWRVPKVLGPDEFLVQPFKGAIQAYHMDIPSDGKPKVYVFQARGGEQTLTKEQRKMLQDRLGKSARRLGQVPRVQAPGAGNPNVQSPMTPALPGGGGGKGGGGSRSGGEMQGPVVGRDGQTAYDSDLRLVDLDKVEDNARIAQTILPRRMVIVTGAFPYKQQLEEYRKAMRYGSIEEMLADPAGARPEFFGFNVQRRKYNEQGAMIDDWTDIDVHADMKRLRMQAVDTEPEDPRLQELGIIVYPNRIVQPLLKLARDKDKYPEGRLESIDKAQAAMQGTAPPPPPQKSRFDIDLYDPKGGTQDAQTPAPAGNVPPPAGKTGALPSSTSAQPAVGIPEKCLVRFIDTDPKPGFSYEYRIQILMSNPCHEKPDRAISRRYGDKEFVEGGWHEVKWNEDGKLTSRVAIPDEHRIYVVDEKTERSSAMANKDRAFVQVHRWIDRAPINTGDPIQVGDWSVLERRQVHRGEFVGKVEETEVPTWIPSFDRFIIAVQPSELKRGQTRIRRVMGIPVDFATDRDKEDNRALVVDFEGGEHTMNVNGKQVRESGPVEMLILTADNRLVVRNSRHDTDNAERQERVKKWKEWVERVRSQGPDEKKKDDLFSPPGAPPGKGGGAPSGGSGSG
jgi:hypothetical protein